MRVCLFQWGLFLLLTFNVGLASGQSFSRNDYKPRTIKEIVKTASDEEQPDLSKDAFILHVDTLPSRVRVTYTGTSRQISSSDKASIWDWARWCSRKPEEYAARYETEVLFIEDSVEYWIPVPKRVLPKLKRELKGGQAVDLYLNRIVDVRTAGKWSCVLLVEEFQKPRESS